MTDFDPERWLETALRGVENYVKSNINTRIYEVVMEFPSPSDKAMKTPIPKTVIHFEVDDVVDRPVGFGERPMTENYDADDGTTNPQWAGMHVINFDVGIWASDKSGGTTARMRAKQELQRLFGFPNSIEALRQATDGGNGCVEIVRYTGGNFAVDTINDMRVFRMMGGNLDVRVFSRSLTSSTPSPAIEEIDQAPGLTILG